MTPDATTGGAAVRLDVLHVDKRDRVTHVLRGIRPWRLGPLFVGNKLAIELPVGGAAGTSVGDEIEIQDLEMTGSRVE